MALSLIWQDGLNFTSGPDGPPLELASSKPGVPSPMQVLAYAVMGCMAMDVAHVLQKGRNDMRGLRVDFEAERATDYPKRYTAMRLHFTVTGAVTEAAVARAIELSHDKYCSVFATLRPDLDFRTSVTVVP